MYKITFKKKAAKELYKLGTKTISRICFAIENLSSNPRPDGSKKLVESEDDLGGSGLGIIAFYTLLMTE